MGASSRDDLIDAVLELSAEGGFARLSLKAVVERAGTDRRGFHRRFDDLEEAFAEGYRRLSESLCTDDLVLAGQAATVPDLAGDLTRLVVLLYGGEEP